MREPGISQALAAYFAMTGSKPDFHIPSSALWRGYVGSWEIEQDRLYLVGLQGTLRSGAGASLATLFPGPGDRAFADWFTGTIRVPRGKLLKYFHADYGSIYEQDLLLEFDRGVLKEAELRQNGKSDNADAPEGYRIGGWASFPRRR